MHGAHGYIGLRTRDRWMSAFGVVAIFLVLFLVALALAHGPARVAPWEVALRTFDVPPPPIDFTPDAPPPTQRSAPAPTPVAKTATPARSGGSPGVLKDRPVEVSVSVAAPVMAAPPTPLVVVDAPPPSAGRSTGASVGGAGGSGEGRGVGRGDGDGPGNGDGTGDGGGASRYARTEWITPPTREDFQREWPRYAPRLSATVEVLLACRVTGPGFLRRCVVLREGQPGQGYGKAAIRVVRTSRVRPVRKDDRALDMPVLVPLAFEPAVRPPRSVPVASTPN